MIPRKTLEIGWSDLAYGATACGWPGSRAAAARRVEALGSPGGDVVAVLSVRSGLDLLLAALELPRGSEILVSAVTIRDMVRIVEAHGLVPVPVDLDMETLEIRTEALRRAWSPRTRVILAAHLFGSRMPLDRVGAFARRRGLLLVEDCAQAYTGPGYRGHPESDVTLFSFGPIKTDTALGGGLARVRNPELRARMRRIQDGYPVAGRGWFLARCAKYAAIALLLRPAGLRTLAVAARLLGTTHDELLSRSVRGFPGPGFFRRIRRQPPYPLLALLARRIATFEEGGIAARSASGERTACLLAGIDRPGRRAAVHSHWVFPVWSRDPDSLARHLWRHGFDATRGASTLAAVAPVASRPDVRAPEARRAMARTLYLPVHPGVSPPRLRRLAALVREHERPTPTAARRAGGRRRGAGARIRRG